MNKILEALKKLLPEDQLKETSAAVEEILTEARKEIESEFNERLEEAYAELAAELKAAEKTAEEGYEEAYAYIADLNNRIEVQTEEFKKTLEDNYEEAYQMLQAERGKNNSTESEIYEEYDKKLQEMKEYIVDKVDQFLQFKGSEIYEQAKRDVLKDPRYAEHKVALDKITDVVSGYITDEEHLLATSSKLDHAAKKIDELEGQIKLAEQRNLKLSRENTKLNEAVRHSANVINENTKIEKKAKIESAKSVTGRGKVMLQERVEVIAEHNDDKPSNKKDTKFLSESLKLDLNTLNTLAGTNAKEE